VEQFEQFGVGAHGCGTDVVDEEFSFPMQSSEPELEFGTQSAPRAQEAGVACGGENEFVEVEVEGGDFVDAFGGAGFVDVFLEGFEVMTEVGCGEARTCGFEEEAHGMEFLEVGFGEGLYETAAGFLELHEAFVCEGDEGLAHRDAADAEAFCDGGFGEFGSRGEGA